MTDYEPMLCIDCHQMVIPLRIHACKAEYVRLLEAVAEKALQLRGALPSCPGEWLSGTGGHRKHGGNCGEPTTYWAMYDMMAYCDKHAVPHDVTEAPWTQELRDISAALSALDAHRKEKP